MNFTIRNEIMIPIHYGTDMNEIAIPPRCEIFKIFKIKNFTTSSFIESNELAPGIFIANTIIHNSTPLIRVINTTESTAVIKNEIKITDELNNYKIFKIEKPENNEDRVNKLKQIFSKNTPKERRRQ